MRNLLLFLFVIFSIAAFGQDTLVLMNGRIIPVKNVAPNGYKIAYRTNDRNKLKKIDTDRVFSIQFADGTEKIVFTQQDSLDYTVPQMRMFIRGEQDATKYYKNTVNKAAAFAVGGGSALLAIYGVIIPPIYSTIVGSSSPNMEKLRYKYATEIQNGKLMVLKNGVALTETDTLPDGTRIMKNGTVTLKDGKTHSLTEKECINNDGKIVVKKVSASSLINDQDYLEGYKSKVRNRKIRNSLIIGFIGFAVGAVAYNIAYHN